MGAFDRYRIPHHGIVPKYVGPQKQDPPVMFASLRGLGEPAQLVDVEKVREVIAHLRQFDNPYMRGLADKLETALPESKP